jgi:hypothetical protein
MILRPKRFLTSLRFKTHLILLCHPSIITIDLKKKMNPIPSSQKRTQLLKIKPLLQEKARIITKPISTLKFVLQKLFLLRNKMVSRVQIMTDFKFNLSTSTS